MSLTSSSPSLVASVTHLRNLNGFCSKTINAIDDSLPYSSKVNKLSVITSPSDGVGVVQQTLSSSNSSSTTTISALNPNNNQQTLSVNTAGWMNFLALNKQEASPLGGGDLRSGYHHGRNGSGDCFNNGEVDNGWPAGSPASSAHSAGSLGGLSRSSSSNLRRISGQDDAIVTSSGDLDIATSLSASALSSMASVADFESHHSNNMHLKQEQMDKNGRQTITTSNTTASASDSAEGVWSSDIDQAFQEALNVYPPCGRRKIILSDEGKMYGRNELIARYIKIRTGKTRTRKQVSSHIQVLARKKSRELQAKLKDQCAKDVSLSGSAPSIVGLSMNEGGCLGVANSMASTSPVGGVKPSSSTSSVTAVSSPTSLLTGVPIRPVGVTATPDDATVAAVAASWSQAAVAVAAAAAAAAGYPSPLQFPSINNPLSLAAAQSHMNPCSTDLMDVKPFQMHQHHVNNSSSSSSFLPTTAAIFQQQAAAAVVLSQQQQQQQQQQQLQRLSGAGVARPTAIVGAASANAPYPSSSSRPPPDPTTIAAAFLHSGHSLTNVQSLTTPWEGRSICTKRFRLCEFSAYCLLSPKDYKRKHIMVSIPDDITYDDPLLEEIDISQVHDKFSSGLHGLRELYRRGPQDAFFLVKFWADISFNVIDEQSTVFEVESRYEGSENMAIIISTKAYSFGTSSVQRVEKEYAKFENGRFVYRVQRSTLCEYMNNFILKLKTLPERRYMNSVLENFTILQVVSREDTQEVLLCLAIVLEVSEGGGCQHRLYKLTHDPKDTDFEIQPSL